MLNGFPVLVKLDKKSFGYLNRDFGDIMFQDLIEREVI